MVRPLTAKRRRSRARYTDSRVPFLLDVPHCEIGYDGTEDGWPERCRGQTEQIHHVVNRSQCHWMEADRRIYCGTCKVCHDYVTAHFDWAKTHGLQFSAFEWIDYEEVPSRHAVDGHTWVMTTGVDGTESIHREEWVMALSAQLITPDYPYDAIGHRNEETVDNRLANFFILHGID